MAGTPDEEKQRRRWRRVPSGDVADGDGSNPSYDGAISHAQCSLEPNSMERPGAVPSAVLIASLSRTQ